MAETEAMSKSVSSYIIHYIFILFASYFIFVFSFH